MTCILFTHDGRKCLDVVSKDGFFCVKPNFFPSLRTFVEHVCQIAIVSWSLLNLAVPFAYLHAVMP